MSTHKICKRCGLLLPIAEFYAHSRMKDGHLNFCKSCTKKRVTAHRECNLDRIRAYEKIKNATPEMVSARLKYQTWYRSVKKNQQIANAAVNNAIRDGRLRKLPCCICNNPKAEAHHENYEEPLNVIWLCSIHHKRLHHKKFSLVPRFT